jgi:hypothetical protein
MCIDGGLAMIPNSRVPAVCLSVCLQSNKMAEEPLIIILIIINKIVPVLAN